MLEDNPILRERILCFGALSAIAIVGAASVDFMLTSGMQFGNGAVAPAPMRLAAISTDRQFPTPPTPQTRPAPVRADAPAPQTAPTGEQLDGAADTAAPPSNQMAPTNDTTPAQDDLSARHATATQSFEHIEAQIEQADPSAVTTKTGADGQSPGQ